MSLGNTWTGLTLVRSRLKEGRRIIHDKCRKSPEQTIMLKSCLYQHKERAKNQAIFFNIFKYDNVPYHNALVP